MSSDASLQAANASLDSGGPSKASLEQRRSVSPMLGRKIAPAVLDHESLSLRSVGPVRSTVPSRLLSARMSACRARHALQSAR
jgi:hypothetical protein